MKRIVISATNGELQLPFSHGDSTSLTYNSTLNFVMTCTPNHLPKVGWHALVSSDGFCLPGESFPACSIQAVDGSGNPIDDFASRHTVSVTLTSYNHEGRISLAPIVPLHSMVATAISTNTYSISGSLPGRASWVQLTIVVDDEQVFNLPLWPVGFPVYLLHDNVSLINDYSEEVLTNSIQLTPYLAKSLSDQVYAANLVVNMDTLLAKVDPASFFTAIESDRPRFNAVKLYQGSSLRAHLEPKISSSTLHFSAIPGDCGKLTPNYPAYIQTFTTTPFMKLTGTAISSYGVHHYSVASKVWDSELIVDGVASALLLPQVHSNFHMSGTPLSLATKSSVISIVASNPARLINLADLSHPAVGDLALVAFNPAPSQNKWLLDISNNPHNWFFYKPLQLSGVGGLQTQVTLQTSFVGQQVLPLWGTGPSLPIYLVEYTGTHWIPLDTINGIQTVNTYDPISVTNPIIIASSFKQADPLDLTRPFRPFSVSGSPVKA